MSKKWYGITDYGDEHPADLADEELSEFSKVWQEYRSQNEGSEKIREYLERLKRESAIETGLIERQYKFDRGITELLIKDGIHPSLIPHNAGGDNSEHTAAMINDQLAAIDEVFSFVKDERKLTTSYIKEWHALLTQRQEYAEGRDQTGQKIKVPLLSGEFKKQPNNPTTVNGEPHFYCPPEHVAAEMDRLIAMYESHEGVAPEVEAAWLHHRFTQIHPFQDGNGRVARVLAILIFIKFGLPPLVVRDDNRREYLDALETADEGDLSLLVSLFARLQKEAIIDIIGDELDRYQMTKISNRIGNVGKLASRFQTKLMQKRVALGNAQELYDIADERMQFIYNSLEKELVDNELVDVSYLSESQRNSGSASFDKSFIAWGEGDLNYHANPREYALRSALVMSRIKDSGPELNYIVISFHCVGPKLESSIACAGLWVHTKMDSILAEGILCDEKFSIGYEDVEGTKGRFLIWLDGVIERGLAKLESALY